jgi:glutaminyl-tRNA synthetase
VVKDAQGEITEIRCTYDPDSKSGTEGADKRKVKGNIQWLSGAHAQPAEVRLYDRLFVDAHPDAGDQDYKNFLNPRSKKIISALVEPSLSQVQPEEYFQFERHGYFIADRKDTMPGKPVFNRAVTLRDSWGKGG